MPNRKARVLVSWLAAVSISTAASLAQAPVVPTDHYGPPVCSATAHPTHPQMVEQARAEQETGASDPRALLAAEPLENFAFARYRLAEYADCTGAQGCYWADLDAQYKRAEAALDLQIAAHKKSEKLAIVMDIDETSLSGYCEMKREDFGYISRMFNDWVISPEAAVAVPGGLRLFNKARSAGVAVFFITGRPATPEAGATNPLPDQTPGTTRNLEAAGYHEWTGLRLRNGPENSMATADYKSSERREIVGQGYRIVLSVGDQWSDLLGEPKAEVSVKLPNPFYFLP